jgi:hypothetical protein
LFKFGQLFIFLKKKFKMAEKLNQADFLVAVTEPLNEMF